MKRQNNLTKNPSEHTFEKKSSSKTSLSMKLRYFSRGFKNRRVKHLPGIAHLHRTPPEKCIYDLPRSITINQVYDSSAKQLYRHLQTTCYWRKNQTLHCIYINTILTLCSGSKWIIWRVQKVEFLKGPIHVNRQN